MRTENPFPIKNLTQLSVKFVRRTLKLRTRSWISILGVVGVVIGVLSFANEATDGAFFDSIFWWRGGNGAPVIERLYARESGQEIEPIVNRGGGIFLNVLAVDPEGDEIFYEWVPPDGGTFRLNDLSNPLTPLVFFLPPARAGEYVVGVRVRDGLHKDFVEDQITVEVIDP